MPTTTRSTSRAARKKSKTASPRETSSNTPGKSVRSKSPRSSVASKSPLSQRGTSSGGPKLSKKQSPTSGQGGSQYSGKVRIGATRRSLLEAAKRTLAEHGANAVIIEQSHFSSKSSRRRPTKWTASETKDLEDGVRKHGEGVWANILKDKSLHFNKKRTIVDLKDKWRNLKNYQHYSARPIRKYVLVNEHHVPMLNPSGNQRVFNSRYPRDAALKAATKDEFYQTDKESSYIYLRELSGANDQPPIVHVYRGTRRVDLAAKIEKFRGKKTMWVACVEKIREEQLYDRERLESS